MLCFNVAEQASQYISYNALFHVKKFGVQNLIDPHNPAHN
jgi:hypothetical protein